MVLIFFMLVFVIWSLKIEIIFSEKSNASMWPTCGYSNRDSVPGPQAISRILLSDVNVSSASIRFNAD